MSRGRVRGGSRFQPWPEQSLAPGWGGSQGCRHNNRALGPTAPSERREELVEGLPKNLEPIRDSRHQCAIHRMPWAPSQGRVNYLPPLVPVGRAGNEQRLLQLTLLCSAWENQRSRHQSLALVQRCGIFQENFKIITERGRHLTTDLEEERERANRDA